MVKKELYVNPIQVSNAQQDKRLYQLRSHHALAEACAWIAREILCSYQEPPKGVNYMIIGDPGVGAAGHSPLFAHGSEHEPAVA